MSKLLKNIDPNKINEEMKDQGQRIRKALNLKIECFTPKYNNEGRNILEDWDTPPHIAAQFAAFLITDGYLDTTPYAGEGSSNGTYSTDDLETAK